MTSCMSLQKIKESKLDTLDESKENRADSDDNSERAFSEQEITNLTAKHDEFANNCKSTYWMFEYRKVKGYFFEKLELNYFPLDIQDLSIVITTFKSNKDVTLIHNRTKSSLVNSKITLDRHIWYMEFNFFCNN